MRGSQRAAATPVVVSKMRDEIIRAMAGLNAPVAKPGFPNPVGGAP